TDSERDWSRQSERGAVLYGKAAGNGGRVVQRDGAEGGERAVGDRERPGAEGVVGIEENSQAALNGGSTAIGIGGVEPQGAGVVAIEHERAGSGNDAADRKIARTPDIPFLILRHVDANVGRERGYAGIAHHAAAFQRERRAGGRVKRIGIGGIDKLQRADVVVRLEERREGQRAVVEGESRGAVIDRRARAPIAGCAQIVVGSAAGPSERSLPVRGHDQRQQNREEKLDTTHSCAGSSNSRASYS